MLIEDFAELTLSLLRYTHALVARFEFLLMFSFARKFLISMLLGGDSSSNCPKRTKICPYFVHTTCMTWLFRRNKMLLVTAFHATC